MSARRPWYGFLYYVLGTRGSFFAWVVALLGVYVTWREAVLWAWNRAPVPARVSEVVASEAAWRRWVQVGGVEIDLASALFAAHDRPQGTAGAYAERILIDRDDPAAVAWRDLFREIEQVRGALLDGRREGADDADAQLKRLGTLVLDIGRPETARRFVPERALFVIASAGAEVALRPPAAFRPGPAGAAGEAGAPTGAAAGETALERWRRTTLERVDLVRSAVRIDVEREGLLEPLPESRRAHYRNAYGVEVARAALGVGHRPSQVLAGAFAAFAVTLTFLVLGLRAGAR